MDPSRSRGLSRRAYVKAALAIGGTSALSACQSLESPDSETGTATDGATFPRGVDDPTTLPARQHAWDDYLVHGAHGTTIQGQHQLLLGLSHEGSMPPTEDEREQVESALRTLERAYQWGSGEDTSGEVNAGLLFMIGYAPSYLDQVGIDVDGLQRPEDVLEAIGEDPSLADGFDALLLFDSDYASILLEAEEAMFGERDQANGVDVETDLTGVFAVEARRTGFLGKGLPAEELDNEDIPEDAALSMGFRAGFDNSLPAEDTVTFEEGPFAEGTTLVTARLETHLDEWYDQPHEERLQQIYSPDHDPEDVGDVGDGLGSHSQVTQDTVDAIPDHADEDGIVGHAAKVAAAREDEEFRTRILRRSEGVATDEADGSIFNFSSIQRDTQAFVDVRQAMKPEEYDDDLPAEDHGIVEFIETVARGTFLVPPRDRRALPVPR